MVKISARDEQQFVSFNFFFGNQCKQRSDANWPEITKQCVRRREVYVKNMLQRSCENVGNFIINSSGMTFGEIERDLSPLKVISRIPFSGTT